MIHPQRVSSDDAQHPGSGRYIGLMSGTSLDGLDGVLVQMHEDGSSTLIASASAPFPDDLRAELSALQASGADEMHRGAAAAVALADRQSALVAALLQQAGGDSPVVAIGSHGQTVRHRPELGWTIQLNAPARLAEATGLTVVSDFRSRDVAAGGQGAPLVPAFHRAVFGRAGVHRVVVNLGGMSNVTDLPADPGQPVRGWDCGPGNVLLDAWVERHHRQRYDRAGAWAAAGHALPALLARLHGHPWFALPPPKSTGRDLFDIAWLDAALADAALDDASVAPADVQATLADLTVTSIVDSVVAHAGAPDEWIVCGGGAHNEDLLRRLGARVRSLTAARGGSTAAPATVVTSAAYGIEPEHVEAMAFAWLAMRCLAGLPGNLPAVTGARGPRVLGAIHQA